MNTKPLWTIIIILAIVSICLGAKCFTAKKTVAVEQKQDESNALLLQVLPFVDKNRLPSSLSQKLMKEYGPCWGITEGQCRE